MYYILLIREKTPAILRASDLSALVECLDRYGITNTVEAKGHKPAGLRGFVAMKYKRMPIFDVYFVDEDEKETGYDFQITDAHRREYIKWAVHGLVDFLEFEKIEEIQTYDWPPYLKISIKRAVQYIKAVEIANGEREKPELPTVDIFAPTDEPAELP